MSSKKSVVVVISLIAAGGAWYLFRPELLFVNEKVSEALPEARAQKPGETVLAQGAFHSGAHETKGTATIHQLAGGRRLLRLTGFETSNGPDVRVLLVAAQDAQDNDTVKSAGFVEVAKLKGNIGDQNYDLPADVDLSKHRAVTIWCNRFGVNFGTAPLVAGARS